MSNSPGGRARSAGRKSAHRPGLLICAQITPHPGDGNDPRYPAQGAHRTHRRRIQTMVARTAQAARRRAQRGGDPVRRHRIFPLRLLRVDHRNTEHRSPGCRRSAIHQLPHHRAVLAHAGVAADRPQPPFGRHARAGQLEHRFSQLHGRRGQERGHPGRDDSTAGLLHLRGRQVASHPDGRNLRGGPLRPMAARARRNCIATTTRSTSRAPPTRVITSPKTWSTRRSA